MRHLVFPVLLAGFPFLAAGQNDTVVKVGKLSATAPAEWKSEKPANRLRSFQFKLPGDKDHPDAELIVSPESNPGVEKNHAMWKATFVVPDGKTPDDISKVTKWDVPGATVTVLDMAGTWKYRERPFDPKSKEELKDDYRVVWVMVTDKDETTHIRLSGPKPTVDKYAAAFEKFVRSLK